MDPGDVLHFLVEGGGYTLFLRKGFFTKFRAALLSKNKAKTKKVYLEVRLIYGWSRGIAKTQFSLGILVPDKSSDFDLRSAKW